MPGLLPPFLRRLYGTEPDWLYRYLSRNVRWGQTRTHLANMSLSLSIITIAITVILGLFSWLFRSSIGVWLLSGFVGFSFIIVDIASIAFAIIGMRSGKEHLDLLTLSHIQPIYFIKAQHQVAQTRTWRILIVMQALRSTLVIIAFTFGIMLIVVTVIFTFGGGLLWIAALVVLALWEPIWRLQMMTAFGVMVASFQRNAIITWMSGLALMFGTWIAHGILGIIPFWILREGNDTDLLIMMTLALPIIAGVIWYGQHRLRDMCLKIATDHIFKPT